MAGEHCTTAAFKSRKKSSISSRVQGVGSARKSVAVRDAFDRASSAEDAILAFGVVVGGCSWSEEGDVVMGNVNRIVSLVGKVEDSQQSKRLNLGKIISVCCLHSA